MEEQAPMLVGLEQAHGNTIHVHGIPWYEFMNLDVSRTNMVCPCSETMNLLLLNIVFCLNMSYITNFNRSKASEYGTYITDDIMFKALDMVPVIVMMSKASGHDLYIHITML